MDHRRRRIGIVSRGFWTTETATSFFSALRHANARAVATGKPSDTFADSTELQVVGQDTAAILQEFFAKPPVGRGRRAMLVAPGLRFMQASRVVVDETVRVFHDRAAACMA